MPQGRCIVAVDPSAAEPSPAENSAEESAVSEPSAIVAFIITEEDPPLAHILTLDVAESHRRYGLGTQLLARSEQELIARGVTEIVLETGIANAAGVAFWQRHDFRTEGVLKRYYLGRLDAYRMRKKLIVAQ
jgi:ribosomal-protein-alanine N-acetyltransferase